MVLRPKTSTQTSPTRTPLRPSAPTRQKAWRQGYGAETLALWMLRLKGYRPLARRLRTPRGEIDLVVARGRTLVLVEVKWRRHIPETWIQPHQQRRIQAAVPWVLRHVQRHCGLDPSRFDHVRFDMVVGGPWRWPQHVTHAWDETFF